MKKHPNQYTYRGISLYFLFPVENALTFLLYEGTNNTHEHGTRRNVGGAGSASASATGIGTSTGSVAASNLSRNTYYNNNQQQPLFTSWNLPDYLAHLQSILPSEIPTPLVICTQISSTDSESPSYTERGVRVKWPAKRMSVSDMNKRVRALVEWVGREQAGALERVKRRQSLQKAMLVLENAADETNPILSISTTEEPLLGVGQKMEEEVPDDIVTKDILLNTTDCLRPTETTTLIQSTETMMEELMEELISFQERFGPGAKGRIKERNVRTATIS